MGAIKNKLPSSLGDHLIILLLALFGLLALGVGVALLVYHFSAGNAGEQDGSLGESLAQEALEEGDGRIVVVLDPGHGGHDPGALDSTEKYH